LPQVRIASAIPGLQKRFATEAHGMTRTKKCLNTLVSVCFRGELGVLIDDTARCNPLRDGFLHVQQKIIRVHEADHAVITPFLAICSEEQNGRRGKQLEMIE